MAVIAEIQSAIEQIETNAALYQDENFDQRAEAIDFLDFHLIERIEVLVPKTIDLTLLKDRAGKLKAGLEAIDVVLFQKLRENITGTEYRGSPFKNLVNAYFDFKPGESTGQEEPGYDNLDIFINRLLSSQSVPEQTKSLEPGMVFYQKTPARIIFELVEKVHFSQQDVFFDLGSGLGQAAILVNLLTGVKAVGVEFEPAFCEYATSTAKELNLSGVTFINTDGRAADYSEGTVFFMYTPFTGEMLQQVLERLKKEAASRKIRIVTYGPCTAHVASQSWLNFVGSKSDSIYKLAVFKSL